MSYDRPTHTYVECCDRLPLFERTTVEDWHGVRVRVCKPGTGCYLDGWLPPLDECSQVTA